MRATPKRRLVLRLTRRNLGSRQVHAESEQRANGCSEKAVRRSHLLRMLTRMVTTVAKVIEFYMPEKLRSANLVLGKAELGIAMDEELKINLQ